MLHAGLKEFIDREVKRLRIHYSVQENAPGSFEELIRHSHIDREIKIYSGGSEHTIYGDPKINYAFRAWHDALHLIHKAPFTLDGETYIARVQASVLGTLGAEIIIAEVKDQAEEFFRTGKFIDDQIGFINSRLRAKGLIK